MSELAEGARLLSEYTGLNLYPGFESLPLHHKILQFYRVMMKIIALFLCLKWGVFGCFLNEIKNHAYFHAYFWFGEFWLGGEPKPCTFTHKVNFGSKVVKPHSGREQVANQMQLIDNVPAIVREILDLYLRATASVTRKACDRASSARVARGECFVARREQQQNIAIYLCIYHTHK